MAGRIRKQRLGTLLAMTIGVGTAPAVYGADCGFPPQEPMLPDGSTATLAELQQANLLVRDFIEIAGNYLVCASNNRDIELAPLDIEQQAAWHQQFEALVEARETIARRFNLQVAAFQIANNDAYPLDDPSQSR